MLSASHFMCADKMQRILKSQLFPFLFYLFKCAFKKRKKREQIVGMERERDDSSRMHDHHARVLHICFM